MVARDTVVGASGCALIIALLAAWLFLVMWATTNSENLFIQFCGWASIACVVAAIGMLFVSWTLDSQDAATGVMILAYCAGVLALLVLIGWTAANGGSGSPIHAPAPRRIH